MNGGAIYAFADVTLIAKDGDMTFRGNTAGGNPNAIYMYNYNDDKTLTLAAEDRTHGVIQQSACGI